MPADAGATSSGRAAPTSNATAPVALAGGAVDIGTLASRARSGDASAFRELFRSFGSMVHALLLVRVGPNDADDLVQDVFLHAWRKLSTLKDAERFGAWITTIARNRAARLHTRSRPKTTELPEELPDSAPHGAAPLDAAEASRAALTALSALPETYRETLSMRLVEGMTGPEIAAATAMTQGSVRVNLTRGMKLLRDALEGKGWS